MTDFNKRGSGTWVVSIDGGKTESSIEIRAGAPLWEYAHTVFQRVFRQVILDAVPKAFIVESIDWANHHLCVTVRPRLKVKEML